jgi:hypothetical protein
MPLSPASQDDPSHQTLEILGRPRPEKDRLSRLVLFLYLVSLVLLPWTWFPPFPWLHEHAQWSDALFAATAILWVIERLQTGWPRLQAAHLSLALYFLFASLSLLFASPDPILGLPKLIGVAELCLLTVITADLASRPGFYPWITKAIALTSLLSAAAAISGLLLFYSGTHSSLIGIYGELPASPWYARVQAGTYNPNLLASFCIFGAGIVSSRDAGLPLWLRRSALAALWATVFLTFSRGILGFVLAAVIRNATTKRRRAIAAVCAASFGVILLGLTVWKPTVNLTHPLETHFDRRTSSRYEAASTALQTLVGHPILGTGLGTHPGQFLGVPFDSHLTPLNIAATLGLPALIVFTLLISFLWRRRKHPTDLAIWGGLAGLGLDGLAQDIEDFRHLWVIIGLAMAHACVRFSAGVPPSPARSKSTDIAPTLD